MEGTIVGVFGTDQQFKEAFESAVAKKSEAAGMAVSTLTEGRGRRHLQVLIQVRAPQDCC